MVRALFLDVPEEILADRRRRGADRRDEVWDGVIHMVPPASGPHMELSFELAVALRAVAQRLGFKVLIETGLFDHDTNYRVPDICIGRPEMLTRRGWDGAELVIEVLSPGDESQDKLLFFAKLRVREVWLVDPVTRSIEVLALRGTTYVPVPESAGAVCSHVLGVELVTVDGPRLRIRDGGTAIDV
jgi:Uma2 family endonuclease